MVTFSCLLGLSRVVQDLDQVVQPEEEALLAVAWPPGAAVVQRAAVGDRHGLGEVDEPRAHLPVIVQHEDAAPDHLQHEGEKTGTMRKGSGSGGKQLGGSKAK